MEAETAADWLLWGLFISCLHQLTSCCTFTSPFTSADAKSLRMQARRATCRVSLHLRLAAAESLLQRPAVTDGLNPGRFQPSKHPGVSGCILPSPPSPCSLQVRRSQHPDSQLPRPWQQGGGWTGVMPSPACPQRMAGSSRERAELNRKLQ